MGYSRDVSDRKLGSRLSLEGRVRYRNNLDMLVRTLEAVSCIVDRVFP